MTLSSHPPKSPLPTSGLDNPFNLAPNLRHCTSHLPRKNIPEARKGLLLPLEILVPALHKLDEFSRVDVRVSRGVHVVNYFRRQRNRMQRWVPAVNGTGCCICVWVVAGMYGESGERGC